MKKVMLLLLLAVLMSPPVCLGQPGQGPVAKISFDFMDADVRNVLRALAEVSRKNMVISDDVKGKVTIKLENVSYDDAFEAVLKTNDLARVEDENVVRVMTGKKPRKRRIGTQSSGSNPSGIRRRGRSWKTRSSRRPSISITPTSRTWSKW